MTLLFKCDMTEPAPWLAALRQQMPERKVTVFPDLGPHESIEYALVYDPPAGLLASLPNLRAVFSLWVGVDHLSKDPDLPDAPIVRMVEYCITASMTQYVVQQVLALHNHALEYGAQQHDRRWQQLELVPPWERKVGIMGLGALGRAAAAALAALEFDVAGWSRSPKDLDGIATCHGPEALSWFLARSQIVVCLLPLTDETHGILNRSLFDRLPREASLINCARGAHLVEVDLLEALDKGKLAAAVLDVFDIEPLPEDHPFWSHERITVTPHIAAFSSPATAVESVVANIERMERGEAPMNTVDFDRGY